MKIAYLVRFIAVSLFILLSLSCNKIKEKRVISQFSLNSSPKNISWENDTLYHITVIGKWNRDKYYCEDDDRVISDKMPKSAELLISDAKLGAKFSALNNFKKELTKKKIKVYNISQINMQIDNIVITKEYDVIVSYTLSLK